MYSDVPGGFHFANGPDVVFFLVIFGQVTGFEVRDDGLAVLLGSDYALAPDAVKAAVNALKALNPIPFEQLFYSGPITFIGSPFGDTITGTDADDIFHMGDGDDTVDARAGNDTVDGGTGNDTLNGGDGVDVLDYPGSNRRRKARLSNSSSPVVVINVPSADPQETDTFQNFENANGSPGDDEITGDANANVFDGNQGKDILKGLDGNDTLIGDKGRDTMEGGAGADRFVFLKANESVRGTQRDKIIGFTHADEIDLSGIDANTHKAGNQKFKFIGALDFNNIDGELRFIGDILAGDTNGNGIADFEVKVKGAASGLLV